MDASKLVLGAQPRKAMGTSCGGLYDAACDGSGLWHLCVDQVWTSSAGSCVYTEGEWATSGQKCVFPWKYGGTTYTDCASSSGLSNSGGLICATDTYSNGNMKGYGTCM